MERRRLRRRHQTRVNLALAGLLVGFVAAGAILAAYRGATALIEHSLEVTSTLERVQSAVTDAESAQRGFLLTGNRAYLAPYAAAVGGARQQVDRLKALAADNAAQRQNVDQLRHRVEDKIDELMATVKAANLDGPEAALAIVRTDRGHQLSADIRAQIVLMASQEGSLLATRDDLAVALLATAVALLAGFVAVSLWIGISGVRGLEHDFREEHDEGEALGHTLAALRKRTQSLREVEPRQRLLIRELHHRIRNMLATVQAIAEATVRSAGTTEAFCESFSARLSALGRTHVLMTEHAWSGVSLCDLIAREFVSFAVGAAPQVHIDGPDVVLPADIALGLGMAFHELTTNAVQFGALSVPQGHVAVTWTTEPQQEADILLLTWAESGGPMVETPKRFGFGTRLLKRVLSRQLNGQVKIDYLSQGVHVTIKAVLPRDPTLGSGPLANAAQTGRPRPASF